MITITPDALERVKKAKEEDEIQAVVNNVDPNSVYLRIGVLVGGCSGFQYDMAFDHTPITSEEFVETLDGIKVVIDPESYPHLAGSTVTWKETLMGGGFQIENPNANRTCGCNKSFS